MENGYQVIKTEELLFSYEKGADAKKVLHGLSFSVQPEERVGVIGCNGVRKSMLLKLLAGILISYQSLFCVCGRKPCLKGMG